MKLNHFRYSEFDSSHLGKPCFRLLNLGEAINFEFHQLIAYFPEIFIDAKIDHDNTSDANHLIGLGFTKIQSQVTYKRYPINADLDGVPIAGISDALRLSDQLILEHAKNFVFDRFHQDPKIRNRYADSLLARWIRNSLNGKKQVCYIGNNFCTYSHDQDVLTVDLVSVLDKRKGYGQALLTNLSQQCLKLGCSQIQVTTEEQNQAARNLYQLCGFNQTTANSVFHYHQG